eukprot:SAG22_NODE_95_length_20791_cov_40.318514_15_plen_204_part_00
MRPGPRTETGRLSPNPTEPVVRTRQGAGPRHIALHPGGRAAYVINERDSTIDTYEYRPLLGHLVFSHSYSTLPPGFVGESFCAAIKVTDDGQFLYGSNRAVEPARSSVVVCRILQSGGGRLLRPLSWATDRVSWPRGISLSPGTSGGQQLQLLVANQRGEFGSTVSVFDRSLVTGLLTLSTSQPAFAVPDPQCIDYYVGVDGE